jgi:EAL and modified HD-GYP domain-containing signal transduction protein
LNLLGQSEMVRWVRLATTLVMGQEKCSDLVLSSLVRARFCELIAAEAKQGYPDLFLMGMMSLMDAILAMPMGLVVRELRLDPRIQAQLLAAKTGEKTSLSPIYDLMIAQEAGDWELVTQQAKQLNMSLFSVAQKSRDAMRWAHQITSSSKATPRP